VPDQSWYTDDLGGDLSDRKASEGLQGKWLVEFSEFARINRSTLEVVKADHPAGGAWSRWSDPVSAVSAGNDAHRVNPPAAQVHRYAYRPSRKPPLYPTYGRYCQRRRKRQAKGLGQRGRQLLQSVPACCCNHSPVSFQAANAGVQVTRRQKCGLFFPVFMSCDKGRASKGRLTMIFPGMDPYLEEPLLWPDVHASFIVYLREHLRPLLRPRYVIAVKSRVFVEGPDTDRASSCRWLSRIQISCSTFRLRWLTPMRLGAMLSA
jgi:Protein of unknown function (DUF4058)/Virulence-associated protein E-like domain